MKKLINIALHTVFGLVLLVAGASAQSAELVTEAQLTSIIADVVAETRLELTEFDIDNAELVAEQIALLEQEDVSELSNRVAD